MDDESEDTACICPFWHLGMLAIASGSRVVSGRRWNGGWVLGLVKSMESDRLLDARLLDASFIGCIDGSTQEFGAGNGASVDRCRVTGASSRADPI